MKPASLPWDLVPSASLTPVLLSLSCRILLMFFSTVLTISFKDRSLRFHRPEHGSRCQHSGLTLRPLSAQLLFRNGRTSPTIHTFKIHAQEFETWEENEVWSQGVCVLAASEEGRATLTSPLTSLSLDFEPPAQS